MNLIDLTGMKFSRLFVIGRSGDKNGQPAWECLCECGKTVIIQGSSLRHGVTKSCGCYRKVAASIKFTKHGMKHSKAYGVWEGIKTRCYNDNRPDFVNYGGRGITVCDRWLNSFENFLADMGNPPPNSTLERKDNNGNYSPDNCMWATRLEQGNNKRNNRLYEYKGEVLTLSQLARKYNIGYLTLYKRIARGHSVANAIESFPGLNIAHTVGVRL